MATGYDRDFMTSSHPQKNENTESPGATSPRYMNIPCSASVPSTDHPPYVNSVSIENLNTDIDSLNSSRWDAPAIPERKRFPGPENTPGYKNLPKGAISGNTPGKITGSTNTQSDNRNKDSNDYKNLSAGCQPADYTEISSADISIDRDISSRKVKLGSGGFGVVYRGQYHGPNGGGRPVAIKCIRNTEYGIGRDELKRMKKETRLMSMARHPDVVTVFGLVSDESREGDQLHAIVMEYMEYGSLSDVMEKVKIPWPVKMKIFLDVSAGMMYLCGRQPHPIIHGDLKAANLLINGNFKVKISDFGTCRLQTITKGTTNLPFKFTMTHVAPELLSIDDPDGTTNLQTEMSDIWSFGITLFEACAEIKPDPTNPDQLDRVPFKSGMSDMQITRMLSVHEKLNLLTPLQKQKIPQDCPGVFINIIELCCQVISQERPNFSKVHENIHREFVYHYYSEYEQSLKHLVLDMTSKKGEAGEVVDVENDCYQTNISGYVCNFDQIMTEPSIINRFDTNKKYILLVTPDAIRLIRPSPSSLADDSDVTVWYLPQIRRFRYSEHKFALEGGRSCDVGPGRVEFFVEDGRMIQVAVERARCMFRQRHNSGTLAFSFNLNHCLKNEQLNQMFQSTVEFNRTH